MNGHLDLFALLRGELDNTGTIAAGVHLAVLHGLPGGAASVAVVGHGLLTRASSTLGNATTQPHAAATQPGETTPSPRRRCSQSPPRSCSRWGSPARSGGGPTTPAALGRGSRQRLRPSQPPSPERAASGWSSTTAGPR